MNERRCREVVKDRSGGRCERCCRYAPLTMHHRKKRSHGGPWTPVNIVAVCGHGTAGCHGWIEHHPKDADEEGWQVWSWEDPANKPVHYRGSDWVLLTSDGQTVPVERLTNDSSKGQYP